MARIRTIKPEFFFNERLAELEAETGLPIRLAYIGLWCQCDREGRFEWRPRRLKAQILPYDDTDLSRVLHALTTRDFLVKYTENGVEYGWIPGFTEHQVINNKEGASRLPKPTENNILTRGPRDGHATATRDARVPIGKEGKGREQGKRERARARTSTSDNHDPPTTPTPVPNGIPAESWASFEQHRKHLGRPLNDIGRRTIWKNLLAIPEDCRAPALDSAISRDLREPCYDARPAGGNGKDRPKPKTALQRAEEDFRRAYPNEPGTTEADDPPLPGPNAGALPGSGAGGR